MWSLRELCTSVIVRALSEQRELDPDQLPDYVPLTVKRSIIHSYGNSMYVNIKCTR